MFMQDHMRGRRHARRLQYIRNMPESERTPFMERVASGERKIFLVLWPFPMVSFHSLNLPGRQTHTASHCAMSLLHNIH